MNTTDSSPHASCCSGESSKGDLISQCPMAAKFNSTLGSTKLKLSLCFIGLALVILGIAIVLVPKIIVWMMASISILIGLALLMMAYFFNRMKHT